MGGKGLPYVVVLRYVPPSRARKERKAYIEERAKRMGGLTPDVALQNLYADARGRLVRYQPADLKYDLDGGLLRPFHRFDIHNASWLSERTAFFQSTDSGRNATQQQQQQLTRRRQSKSKSKRTNRRGLLSSCCTRSYLQRHPLSALRPCAEPHRYACRHMGVGRGSHCVRRFKLAPTATQSPPPPPPSHPNTPDEPAEDLAGFLCAHLGLP